MGWGCYRHEADGGSEAWQAQLEAITPHNCDPWGRDEKICPWCVEELLIAASKCKCGSIPSEMLDPYRLRLQDLEDTEAARHHLNDTFGELKLALHLNTDELSAVIENCLEAGAARQDIIVLAERERAVRKAADYEDMDRLDTSVDHVRTYLDTDDHAGRLKDALRCHLYLKDFNYADVRQVMRNMQQYHGFSNLDLRIFIEQAQAVNEEFHHDQIFDKGCGYALEMVDSLTEHR